MKFRLDAKNLAAHDAQAVEDAQPRRWAVAMFVPHGIILKAVGSGIDVGPGLTDVMKEHFLAERSTSTMIKHSYPDRSVLLKRAEETQSQPDSIPTEADEYGCDDPYAWVAEHKSSERWTWECDRAVRRTASQAQQGKQVTTKKVGCPVRYHLWLVNGRWVAGQTCNHMGHGVASPDKFTKLTPNAKAAVTQLCHTRAMCPMTIYLVLKDPSRSAAMNLDDTDRSTVTQRSVAREVDRLAALRRDNNLVHGIERSSSRPSSLQGHQGGGRPVERPVGGPEAKRNSVSSSNSVSIRACGSTHTRYGEEEEEGRRAGGRPRPSRARAGFRIVTSRRPKAAQRRVLPPHGHQDHVRDVHQVCGDRCKDS